MEVEYKVIGQVCPTNTNAQTLYTVPAGRSAIISTIVVANISASAKSFTLAVRPAGATIENKHYIAYNVAIAANDSTTLTLGITLAATDVVTVFSSAASSISFNAFGSEVIP
jgi:hypothetical protein